MECCNNDNNKCKKRDHITELLFLTEKYKIRRKNTIKICSLRSLIFFKFFSIEKDKLVFSQLTLHRSRILSGSDGFFVVTLVQ